MIIKYILMHTYVVSTYLNFKHWLEKLLGGTLYGRGQQLFINIKLRAKF